MAVAVVDRTVHHGRLIQFHGESYRVRNTLMQDGCVLREGAQDRCSNRSNPDDQPIQKLLTKHWKGGAAFSVEWYRLCGASVLTGRSTHLDAILLSKCTRNCTLSTRKERRMRNPLTELENANRAIERSIECLEFQDRGVVSQNVVGNLRHLVEHVAMFSTYGDKPYIGEYYTAIKHALAELKRNGRTRFIWEFHELLQKVSSHYVPNEDASERLLLKYIEYLVLLKGYAFDSLNIRILSNLMDIPLNIDPGLAEYHELISSEIDRFMSACSPKLDGARFYARNVRPFLVKGNIYYEITLVPALDTSSKFDHILAFSSFRIPSNYSVRLSTKSTSINCLGSSLPITIVDAYEVSIRPCELNSLLRVLGKGDAARVSGKYGSYISLMSFMTRTRMSLCEIARLPEAEYEEVMNGIVRTGENCPVHILLNEAHVFFQSGGEGENVLSYLLSWPRNRVLRDQLGSSPNPKLGNLFLKYGCVPFDVQPYCTSLLRHEIAAEELYSCIDSIPYEDNHFARLLAQTVSDTGSLYIEDAAFAQFDNIDCLIRKHNSALYEGHAARRIVHEMGHVFVQGDEDDAADIISGLLALSKEGLSWYTPMCESWLRKNPNRVDDPVKEGALRTLFADTKVSLVYGSAGTGKTTMMDIVCSVMRDVDKVAIASTNPAVENLRRKIDDRRCEFKTIAKYLYKPVDCDILIVDECSTVSNREMCRILENGKFELLILVGDERQIESIRFGSWFSLVKRFLPKKCIHEFANPWRATNNDLSKLWDSVRNLAGDTEEILSSCYMTSKLDETVLSRNADDEILLCLSYGGLYGINNMNRLLQAANPNRPCKWNLHVYKVGDPVLFNESSRFYPLLYNNMKGRIEEIDDRKDGVMTFTVTVDATMSEMSTRSFEGLEFLGYKDGMPLLRFSVKEPSDQDEEQIDDEAVIPFQVAYAVSIHKAQGLEYSSVKLVLTKDAESRITHNIFYTAITRARETLRIYWSPESQKKIISGFVLASKNKDASLLSNRRGLKLLQ